MSDDAETTPTPAATNPARDFVEQRRAARAATPVSTGIATGDWQPPKRPWVWFASQGFDVIEAQRLLESAGFYSAAEGDNEGHFGPATEEATRAFQKAVGLEPTAVVDDVTWIALATYTPR